MDEYRKLKDNEILKEGDVYEESDGTLIPVDPAAIGCRASIALHNNWKRKIEPIPIVTSEVERGLKAIDDRLGEISKILQEARNLSERVAPQGSERERIALRLWENSDFSPQESFDVADEWIAERDRQRAQAKANAQPTI